MLPIIKKDSLYFIIAVLIIYPLLASSALFLNESPIIFLMLNTIFMYLLVLGPFTIVEMDEDKSDAYHFLAPMPLKNIEIIAAKFLLYLSAITVLAAVMLLFSPLHMSSAELLDVNNRLIIEHAKVCLLGTGIFFIGTIWFGFNNFFRYGVAGGMSVILTTGVIAGQLLFIQNKGLGFIFVILNDLKDKMLASSLMGGILQTLLVYSLLFCAALYLKNRKTY